MSENKLVVRSAAGEDDIKSIWQIRNFSAVRRNSKNPRRIGYNSHKIWFENKYLKSRANYCFVLEQKKDILGYCRLDLDNDKYIISLAIKPGYQGGGLGNILLNQTLNLVKIKKEIIAEIKLKNLSSLKLFQKNGFEISQQDKKIFRLKFNGRKNDFNKEAVRLYYLILKQPRQKSQAIVWPQGDRYDRGKKVLELFKGKLAPMIIITGNNMLIGRNVREEEKNVSVESMADWLTRRGVSRQNIIIDENSLNTKEQAEYIINLAKNRKYKSIIIVGSAYHQPRLFLTFLKYAKISGWQGKIINQPAVMPWEKIPGGRKKFVWQYFMEEAEKISEYKKDLINARQGIKYLTKA